jgi:polyisoprenoid-binding protein YceI
MKVRDKALLCGIVLLSIISRAWAGEIYHFDPAHSTIAFGIHHFVGVTNGKFTRFAGTIDLEREHPERSSVEAKIQVGSIDTGINKRDDHLRSEEFFDVAKYPQITFKSRSVKPTGTQSGDVAGDLTMHGVTRPVTLHVKLLTSLHDATLAQRSRWEVTTEPLKRRDFGLMFSSTAETLSGIGQDVMVKMTIEATKGH